MSRAGNVVDVALGITEQQSERKDVTVTAVCEIFKNPGRKKPERVGQGCLLYQCNECYLVTADTVIPDGGVQPNIQYDVKFTKKRKMFTKKEKCFCLMDIKKEVKYHSGLAIFFIDLNSPNLKHGNKTCSIFIKSPLTITALGESKKQLTFCYIDKKRFNLKVSNNSTIEFPDHAPRTIPNGLVILQTASNLTDNKVFDVGIQRQVHGNQKIITIWMNEILGSLAAPITAPGPPSVEPPNPGTAFNLMPANGYGQQSLTGTATAANQPDEKPQNPVLNSETAAGDADHNSQRTERASLLNCINGGFTEHEKGPTNHPIQEESEQSATDGASDKKDGAVPQNFEHYLVSDKIKENRDLQNMLADYLDRTCQYAIKTWEDLASTEVTGAPLDIRRKCKLRGQRSCALMLFELLASDVTYRDKKVRELIEALQVIHQEAKGLIEESPAYKSGKENFLNKKISEFVDDFKLIDDMATCLDQTSMYERTPFWRLLGTKLGVPKEKLDEIQHCEVNSTKALMECYYSINPNITIEQFYEVVETQLKRDDVLKILNPIAM
ncbi:uncharacterized protein [Acropora muricata]|uniref:uncharacterized protein isoform X2 n=1 Tax=Acropora muricata TaxID=159855 RepID=UPI0034E5B57D